MCGLAGIARGSRRPISVDVLWRMAAAIRHRGPDDWNVAVRGRVGLAHVRLSVIDIDGGAQPLVSASGRTVIAYNGEVYNYRELRAELEAAGCRFRTRSDTEVLVCAYERWGEGMLERLNGQFAFALHDGLRDTVFLARDRFGVRPLFFTVVGGDLYFASEAKALFACGQVAPAPDMRGLDETFGLWAARSPRTVFRGVQQLEPGACATWRDGRLSTRRWYDFEFREGATESHDAIERLDDLMRSSVALRMRSDVPVGAYLSGGLDSSITSALAAGMSPYRLRTFSITFADPRYDESEFQLMAAAALSTDHHVVHIGDTEIADVFPQVVWHAETPLLRTAPAPMYLLARATRQAGIKVVLTGEGSDELFLGYDLFKEAMVRRFCLRQPQSHWRPLLFDRLYPYMKGSRAGEFWRRFFLTAGSPDDPLFSHSPRFALASRIRDFYSSDMRAAIAGSDPLATLRDALPRDFMCWSPENRAAWLEITQLLPSYLLSSQGDRMALAHGVEGRFPFLDHHLFEFAAALPSRSRLRGLHDKDILRRWASGFLPARLSTRPKQPYRAPDAAAFFQPAREWVRDLLSPDELRRTGYFDPASVTGLVRRCALGRAQGTAENQALVAILSTQLWHRGFMESGMHLPAARPATERPAVAVPA